MLGRYCWHIVATVREGDMTVIKSVIVRESVGQCLNMLYTAASDIGYIANRC